jgi:proline dehydrogenase
MGLMRTALLAGSRSTWLRERATRYGFVRRSVSRFMPGERVEDGLGAAESLRPRGIATILTQLGENITDLSEGGDVTRHYLEVLERVSASGLDAQISVKLTQLGLDQDKERCFANLMTLVERAVALRNFVWIDMESSEYVDPTLDQFRRARATSDRVGVALQAYLRRTPADLESLLPLGPAVRLVKGAYREPPELAFPRKRDVDEAYYSLATRFLSQPAMPAGAFLGIATHDGVLIERVRRLLAGAPASPERYEFEMLYGIQRPLQNRLVDQGCRLRVLISYGDYWFPWYMRRLAERPANVLFVVRSLLAG